MQHKKLMLEHLPSPVELLTLAELYEHCLRAELVQNNAYVILFRDTN